MWTIKTLNRLSNKFICKKATGITGCGHIERKDQGRIA